MISGSRFSPLTVDVRLLSNQTESLQTSLSSLALGAQILRVPFVGGNGIAVYADHLCPECLCKVVQPLSGEDPVQLTRIRTSGGCAGHPDIAEANRQEPGVEGFQWSR